jgi:adenine phosphoribosyltransferase
VAGWRDLIRDVPDFPRTGIVFKDITPLLADADGFAAAIDAMAAPWRGIALDAVPPGARVLIVDDVLATGGTLAAVLALARVQGADVVGAAVLVELGFLGGRARWDPAVPLETALAFD